MDKAEDEAGDTNSVVSVYVASMVQSEAVEGEEVEFGHIPPKTYREASVEERVGEKDKPAERKFAPNDGSLEDTDKRDHVSLFLPPPVVKRHSSDPAAPLLQSPDNTVRSPSSSISGMNAFDVEVDKKGRLAYMVEREGVDAWTVSKVFKRTSSNCEEEGCGEKMYAELPFCDTSSRVGLYGSWAAVAVVMSAKRLKGRRRRFRRIMFVCRQIISGDREGRGIWTGSSKP